MSLISYKQRMKLSNSLNHEILRYYRENLGKFTFMEFLNFREYLRKKYTNLYATEKYPNRIPQYIWERYSGVTETLYALAQDHIEGGYLVFGKIYGHGDRKSTIELQWQRDLCPDDPSFRQKLLNDNYVQVWKKTGIIYSDGFYEKPKPELPFMTFYTEIPGVFRYNINLGKGNSTTGTEPFKGTTDKYKKVFEIMKTYKVHMCNVEEL